MKRYLKAKLLKLKGIIRFNIFKTKKVKYKLTKTDKDIIKFMEDKYDMLPYFNDDGLYTFDMKPQPSFKDSKIHNIEN